MKKKLNNYKDTLSMEQRLQSAINELSLQKEAIDKRAAELLIANKELAFQNEEKEKRAAELIIANKELAYQNKEKEKRAAELLIANKELAYQNEEKEKRAAELSEILERVSFLATIASNIQDPIIAYDNNFCITSWNDEAVKLFGWKREEVIGKNIREILKTINPDDTWEQILQSLTEKGHWKGEAIYHPKSGNPLNILATSSQLKDVNGNTYGILVLARDITERRKAENALNTLNEALEQRVKEKTDTVLKTLQEKNIILESFGDGFFALDSNWTVTYWNRVAAKNLGVKKNDIIGKNLWEIFPGSEDTISYRNHHHAMETRQPIHFEDYYPALNIWNEISSYPSENGLSIFFKDITERKIVKEKLIKSNRLYAFTSAINQMIVKTTDETALYNEACRIAVDIGKFRMLWIGMIDEAKKNVLPLVHAGEDEGYLTKMSPISIADIPEGRGPTGTALREGRFIVSNDIENDPQMAPWKETTAERGYLSCIAFPLRKFGKVIGSYTLYAPVKNFFDDAEIALLQETVDNISHALENLEKTKLHQKAEEKLRENYALLRITGEIAKLGGWYFKLEENRLYWSDEVAILHEMPPGYAPLVEDAIEFYAPEWREKIREVFTNCLQKGIPYDELMEIFTASGKRIWVRTIGEALRDTNGKIVKVQGIFQNITERKKIEKALVEYQYALNESSIVAITDQKGIIKHVNEIFCKISKYSTEELIGQDHHIINSGYHPKSFIRNLWVTIANGKIWRGEMCNKAKDGSIYWVDTTIVPILDEHDKPIQYIAIRADITVRKKAEKEINLLAKRLQLATNSAGMGIWDLDIVNNNLVWDEGMYRLYKIDEKQLGSVYDGWTARLHPQDMERVNGEMQKAIAGRKEYDTDFRIVLDDSSVRYLKASAVVERDAEGKALHMIGVNWDITELKEKENELRKGEVFNRSVVNSLSAHMSVVNDTGQIVSINEAWKRFALENGDSSMQRTGIGSNYFEVCEKASMEGDEIAPQVLKGMKDVLNRKADTFYIEYPCHSPSEQKWFGLRIAKFEGGEPLILMVHTNLTERIIAEREREKITNDLIQRNQELQQFTYIISHNLRAPVANIIGLSQWLGDKSLSKDDAEIIANGLLSSVNKLDTVIIDLNNILQLKSSISEAKEQVVFAELVHSIKESISSMILHEDIKILTQFDEAPDMMTLKSFMHSIFYNLISNSIKYKKHGIPSVIDIRSHSKKDKIELIFKDNGRGIDLKKNEDQVFGLYKRFHREIEGKGMGLFMVKTQVEALGGKISIESEVDKGTEFKIVLLNHKKHEN